MEYQDPKGIGRAFLLLGIAAVSHLSLASFIAVAGGRHLAAMSGWRGWEMGVMTVLLLAVVIGYASGIALALRHRACRPLLVAGLVALGTVVATVIANLQGGMMKLGSAWFIYAADSMTFVALPLVVVLGVAWGVSARNKVPTG